MSRVVQVSFTDKEFADLERLAQEEGVTVPFYIKSKVLEDTEFQQWFQELLIRTGRIPKDTAFNIKAVFGTDWISISKGVRLALGRSFYNYVNAGKVPGVVPTEKIVQIRSGTERWNDLHEEYGQEENKLNSEAWHWKRRIQKAIRDGLLLSSNDKDAYECGIKFFNNRCAYCGMSGDVIQLTADHIVPSAKGGRFVKGNIVPACQKCNSIRRDQPIDDFVNDPQVLEKIKDFQSIYQFKESEKSLDAELGENGKFILEQLDAVLIIIRDVAREAIRANERNEILPLEEWVKDINEVTKKYGLI